MAIQNELIKLAEKLSEIKEHEEKIKFLAKFDNFLITNKDIIKAKFSALVTGILRSL